MRWLCFHSDHNWVSKVLLFLLGICRVCRFSTFIVRRLNLLFSFDQFCILFFFGRLLSLISYVFWLLCFHSFSWLSFLDLLQLNPSLFLLFLKPSLYFLLLSHPFSILYLLLLDPSRSFFLSSFLSFYSLLLSQLACLFCLFRSLLYFLLLSFLLFLQLLSLPLHLLPLLLRSFFLLSFFCL